MAKRFAGKTVVITGGTSGIGLATAKLFHAEGAKVAVTGRDQKKLDEAASTIGDGTLAVKADVSKLSDIDNLFAVVTEKFGKIDVLFANAGVAKFMTASEMTEDDFDQMVDTNIKGIYFTLQKALPALNDNAGIVLDSSVVNSKGNPGTTVYAATKAAIRSFARTFASELLDRGIRVNAVCPGPVLTPIMDNLGMAPAARDEYLETLKNAIPMKRLGTPEEVGNAVLFLAGNDASYITGAELYVDGGIGQL